MQSIIFDRDSLYENMGGMEDLMKSSIEVFIEYSPEYLLKIKNAIDIKNIEEMNRSAHSLKGSALNAGAGMVVETLISMEMTGAGEDSIHEAGRLFAELEKNIADYIEEVKKQGMI